MFDICLGLRLWDYKLIKSLTFKCTIVNFYNKKTDVFLTFNFAFTIWRINYICPKRLMLILQNIEKHLGEQKPVVESISL